MKWCNPDVGDDEIEAVAEAIREGWLSGFGPRVREFEKAVEQKFGVKHAIAVCNGTCGLIAAFLAFKRLLGYDSFSKPNIVVPTWTFIATATTADMFGQVRFVEPRLDTFNIDVQWVPNTYDFVCPVDVGGVPVDYDGLRQVGLPIIADSCEAFGAKYDGRHLGAIADATVFSFHATKIITTGEGGMVTTNRSDVADMVRGIVNLGYKTVGTYEHVMAGYNFRMNELSAALGLVQLKKLDRYVQHRQRIANVYMETLNDVVTCQHVPDNVKPSYWTFTVLTCPKLRDGIRDALLRRGVPTRVWIPMHQQPPFIHYDDGQYKVADYLAKSTIHLPMNNRLTEAEALSIGETICNYLKGKQYD